MVDDATDKVYIYDDRWNYTFLSQSISPVTAPRGLFKDGNYWYVVDNSAIYKYDTSWNYLEREVWIYLDVDQARGLFRDNAGYWLVPDKTSQKVFIWDREGVNWWDASYSISQIIDPWGLFGEK